MSIICALGMTTSLGCVDRCMARVLSFLISNDVVYKQKHGCISSRVPSRVRILGDVPIKLYPHTDPSSNWVQYSVVLMKRTKVLNSVILSGYCTFLSLRAFASSAYDVRADKYVIQQSLITQFPKSSRVEHHTECSMSLFHTNKMIQTDFDDFGSWRGKSSIWYSIWTRIVFLMYNLHHCKIHLMAGDKMIINIRTI